MKTITVTWAYGGISVKMSKADELLKRIDERIDLIRGMVKDKSKDPIEQVWLDAREWIAANRHLVRGRGPRPILHDSLLNEEARASAELDRDQTHSVEESDA